MSTLEFTSDQIGRENFAERAAAMLEAAEERARSRQHPKGRLTARERITRLLDPNTFHEINRFQGGDIDAGFLGSAVITGFGTIDERMVAVWAQDFSVQGGTLGQVEGEKIVRLIEQALTLRIPIISLLDSGGARIQEGVTALAEYGRIFKATSTASGVIPQISVILGPCAGGAVYGPALTDFIIMTKRSSYMFVTGPSVVKAATGEEISSEDLGGGDLHNTQSGVAHFLAEDEDDALEYARALMTYLPSNCQDSPPHYAFDPSCIPAAAARVGDLVPESAKQPYDMVSVVEALVDHGEFLEVQSLFAPSIVVGFACFEGRPVGIVANQPLHDAGTLDVNASEKAARFVQFCDAFGLPIVTLVDVPGYRPGSEQERAGIIRRGAKMITAYSSATVPLITVIIRKAYGGAYIVMGSKSLGADVNYSWPASEIAVMGSEGAVDILFRRELIKAGEDGKSVAEQRAKYQEEYAKQSVNPNLSLKKGELDALIEPSQTRSVICRSLSVLRTKQRECHSPRIHANAPL
ncbi:acyl-CoA carboxylase subunit beta [Trueperella sp. LYQ141]|uniref:acyl-CoA carboxylase subunit beta n=1 Tax=Trueperella sp. LYQ141 TaxID=3391058 RepID=UPI003983123D